MGTTKKIKAILLVLDYNLWPRQTEDGVDSTNLNRMKAALRSGYKLPPVIVNTTDNRVIDGFHRVKAALSVFGDDVTIEADFRTYKSDAEMFLDTLRLNAHQGLPLNSKDRAHSILRCRKLKLSPAAIAEVLHVDVVEMTEFIKKRSAKTQSGEVVPLSYGATPLAGKVLTKSQEEYVRRAGPCLPEMYASMLLTALKADAVIYTESTLAKLLELMKRLQVIFKEAA